MAKTITLHGHTYELVTAPAQKRRFWENFCNSSDVELSDVYGSYSRAKENAYEYCRAREREFGSYNGVITTYCIMFFTYAFTGVCEGKEWLIYITPSHDYAIELED